MGTYNTRLGCQLSFDEDKESDIITAIQELTASHKLGQFISNVLRLAFDNPEVIEVKNGKVNKGAIIKALEVCGLTHDRNKYINQLSREVSILKKKVDDVYDMSMKMYTLCLMNKYIGLESKSDNMLKASFILEKQVKDLQDVLNTGTISPVFASEKLNRAHKFADEAMEFIIESYDGIIKELQENVSTQKVVYIEKEPEKEIEKQVVKQENVLQNNQSSITVEPIEPEDDEVIDFGNIPETKEEEVNFDNADIATLMDFFGDN